MPNPPTPRSTDQTVKVGQVRQHRRTGLALKVLRQESRKYRGPGWIIEYLPPDVQRGKNERWYDDETLRDYYPVAEDPS